MDVAASPNGWDDMGSSTVARENFDEVTVDLSDGRDYPIYIGAGYSDEEGKTLDRNLICASRCPELTVKYSCFSIQLRKSCNLTYMALKS